MAQLQKTLTPSSIAEVLLLPEAVPLQLKVNHATSKQKLTIRINHWHCYNILIEHITRKHGKLIHFLLSWWHEKGHTPHSCFGNINSRCLRIIIIRRHMKFSIQPNHKN